MMARRRSVARSGVWVPCALVAVACASGGDESPPAVAACGPRDVALTAAASLDGRAGEHRLIMVATSGDSSGAEATGSLWLAANDSTARVFAGIGGAPDPNVLVPSFGWTDVAVETVGARRLGDLMSEDPSSPGVLVLEQRINPDSAPGITVRLGSLANRRDVVRFDGGYTALRVGWIEEGGGFGGTWASGVQDVEGEGYFCATPIE